MQTTRGRQFLSVLAALVFAFGPVARLHGQEDMGRIIGTVHDPSGALVANAQLTARLSTTGAQAQAASSADGSFVFPGLQIGSYDLTITVPGFATVVEKGIRVISSVTTTVNVALKLGNTTETVNVTAAAEILDTTATSVGTTRTVEEINQLPLLLDQTQRSSVSFARTFPGVSWTPGLIDDGSQGINVAEINGAPEGGVGYMVDGTLASVSGHGQLRDDFSPPPEMIEEMRLTSNTASEYSGWNSGVGVALVTKSGTNSLHGDLFEYLRNDALDAANYYATSPTPNKQNEFGFTVGGPVAIPHLYNGRNKTFFFGMYSGYRLRLTPSGVSATVPTDAMRNGDFSELLGPQIGTDALGRPIFQGEIYDPATTRPDGSGGTIRDPFDFGGQLNHIDPTRFSGVSSFFQQGYPEPTQAGTQLNWVGQAAPSPVNSDKFAIKIDQNLGSSQKFSFGYDHWWRNEVFGAPFAPVISGTWLLTDNTWRTRMSYQWAISPTLLFDIRGAFNRARDRLASTGANTTGGGQAGLTGVSDPSTPSVGISDASGFGPPFGGHLYEPDWMVPANADLSWTKGSHNIKFGAAYVSNNAVDQTNLGAGSYNFIRNETGLPGAPAGTGWGYASYLLGEVDSASYSTPDDVKYQSTTWGFYAQDSWKATSKLTLSYGLRWDIFVPAHEHQDEISSFDPTIPNSAAGGLLGALTFWGKGSGRNGRRSIGNIYWKEFSPRFGFAYNVTRGTVVRGSYGLSSPGFFGVFDSGYGLFKEGWTASTTPASLDNGVTPAFNWSNGFPPLPVVPNLDPTLANGNAVPYLNPAELQPGRTENATFGLEQQLPGGIVLAADYVGNFTRGLTDTNIVQLNQLDPKYLALGNLLLADVNSPQAQAAGIAVPYPGFVGSVSQALRPYPQYQNINEMSAHRGFNEYNSLQVTAQKHTGFGLSFLAAYTLSKELDNHSTFNGQGQATTVLQYTGHAAHAKQLADLDRPQMLQMSALYELPFGNGKPFLNQGSNFLRQAVGGWSMAVSGSYMSGTPVEIATSQSLPGGYGAIFANRVPGVPVTLESCSQYKPADPNNHLLNINAFADPPPFSFGDTRVLGNTRTCGYKNENISVIKNFRLGERVTFKFGIDFDNAFNRHNWRGLNTNIDNPSSFGRFGSVALGVAGAGAGNGTGASDPREIQVHAHISF